MNIISALYDVWLLVLGVVEPFLPECLHWNELRWTFDFYLNDARLLIYHHTHGLEPWEIVVNTIVYCFFAFLLLEALRIVVPFIFFNKDGFFHVIKKILFKTVRRIPFVRNKIQSSVDQAVGELQSGLFDLKGQDYMMKLPSEGLSPDAIRENVRKYKGLDHIDWGAGQVSGVVYFADDQLDELMADVYKEFIWTNPLHSDIFPGVRKMEAEVVRMVIDMFHGDENCCGVMTSGGTESIIMACLAYRDIARERGIETPEIVAPRSVHPAFDKAAHYFNMKLRHVDVDNEGRGDIRGMKRAINRNTILIVGSCPSYPHGCIDLIEEYNKLALKYNIYLHVDCCLGGFLVPFMEKAGYHIPKFDFDLPAVSSISCDVHKYGYTPKGASVIMYRNKNLRKHQYFSQTDWSGGVYTSASMPGSRPGNVVATTWASLVYHGQQGYIDRTRRVIETTRYIAEELEKIPGIKLMSPVDVSVIGFTSDIFDVFLLSAELTRGNWHLSTLQFPSGLHIAVTMQHTKPGVADRFINDVTEIAKRLMENPSQKAAGKAALYGTAQQISDRSIIADICAGFLDTYYSVEAGIPSS